MPSETLWARNCCVLEACSKCARSVLETDCCARVTAEILLDWARGARNLPLRYEFGCSKFGLGFGSNRGWHAGARRGSKGSKVLESFCCFQSLRAAEVQKRFRAFWVVAFRTNSFAAAEGYQKRVQTQNNCRFVDSANSADRPSVQQAKVKGFLGYRRHTDVMSNEKPCVWTFVEMPKHDFGFYF